MFFFFKQKTAYEMRISDWSSDVCSSDLVQGIAPTAEMAEELTITATRQLFYARLPEVKGTAGGVSFVLDEVMRASAAYRWTLNHTLAVKDGLQLFPTHMTEAGL